MSRKPRSIQPWSSPKAARRHLAAALGDLESEGYLSSVASTVSSFEWHLEANRLRKYQQAILAATEALTSLEQASRQYGFLDDARELSVSTSSLAAIRDRHRARTDPDAVRGIDGEIRYQLPTQLPPYSGNGEWLESEEELETIRGLAAAFGAAAWFERVKGEGFRPPRDLGPALLFVTAVALRIEPPTREPHNLKDGVVDKAQRRWGKRLKLARSGSKSRLTVVIGDDWRGRTEAEQQAVRVEVARLRKVGRPVEARLRELSLAMPRERGNRSAR